MTAHSPYLADLAEGRETIVNWERLVQNIVDEYEKQMGIIHRIQKDAIQNGWDARIQQKGEEWSFTFELFRERDGLVYLTMTDSGTHGLTGSVLSPEEMEFDLPSSERWGRFESLAFTKVEEEAAIGARGQGKFIFVGASKDNAIYYDSLREDNTYRLGARAVIERTHSRVNHWDEDEGRILLHKRFPSLKPLSNIGTRVIIVNPIDDLLQSIKNDSLIDMIADTWWEIIQKYNGTIIVKDGKKELRVQVPAYIANMPVEDTDRLKVWIRENDAVQGSAGERYRIKRLHLVWQSPEKDHPDIRGIAVQRSGMKVCALEPPRDLPKDISDGIYGYIQFDRDLDRLMAERGVSHSL